VNPELRRLIAGSINHLKRSSLSPVLLQLQLRSAWHEEVQQLKQQALLNEGRLRADAEQQRQLLGHQIEQLQSELDLLLDFKQRQVKSSSTWLKRVAMYYASGNT
jgi:hypothetical protein